ncbi:unnamed protein product [Amoebophrya sp. A25]|nr:unnamed protein product [Amoebophrya sp. A25]|eukprot:GSA25T00009774001.1
MMLTGNRKRRWHSDPMTELRRKLGSMPPAQQRALMRRNNDRWTLCSLYDEDRIAAEHGDWIEALHSKRDELDIAGAEFADASRNHAEEGSSTDEERNEDLAGLMDAPSLNASALAALENATMEAEQQPGEELDDVEGPNPEWFGAAAVPALLGGSAAQGGRSGSKDKANNHDEDVKMSEVPRGGPEYVMSVEYDRSRIRLGSSNGECHTTSESENSKVEDHASAADPKIRKISKKESKGSHKHSRRKEARAVASARAVTRPAKASVSMRAAIANMRKAPHLGARARLRGSFVRWARPLRYGWRLRAQVAVPERRKQIQVLRSVKPARAAERLLEILLRVNKVNTVQATGAWQRELEERYTELIDKRIAEQQARLNHSRINKGLPDLEDGDHTPIGFATAAELQGRQTSTSTGLHAGSTPTGGGDSTTGTVGVPTPLDPYDGSGTPPMTTPPSTLATTTSAGHASASTIDAAGATNMDVAVDQGALTPRPIDEPEPNVRRKRTRGDIEAGQAPQELSLQHRKRTTGVPVKEMEDEIRKDGLVNFEDPQAISRNLVTRSAKFLRFQRLLKLIRASTRSAVPEKDAFARLAAQRRQLMNLKAATAISSKQELQVKQKLVRSARSNDPNRLSHAIGIHFGELAADVNLTRDILLDPDTQYAVARVGGTSVSGDPVLADGLDKMLSQAASSAALDARRKLIVRGYLKAELAKATAQLKGADDVKVRDLQVESEKRLRRAAEIPIGDMKTKQAVGKNIANGGRSKLPKSKSVRKSDAKTTRKQRLKKTKQDARRQPTGAKLQKMSEVQKNRSEEQSKVADALKDLEPGPMTDLYAALYMQKCWRESARILVENGVQEEVLAQFDAVMGKGGHFSLEKASRDKLQANTSATRNALARFIMRRPLPKDVKKGLKYAVAATANALLKLEKSTADGNFKPPCRGSGKLLERPSASSVYWEHELAEEERELAQQERALQLAQRLCQRKRIRRQKLFKFKPKPSSNSASAQISKRTGPPQPKSVQVSALQSTLDAALEV